MNLIIVVALLALLVTYCALLGRRKARREEAKWEALRHGQLIVNITADTSRFESAMHSACLAAKAIRAYNASLPTVAEVEARMREQMKLVPSVGERDSSTAAGSGKPPTVGDTPACPPIAGESSAPPEGLPGYLS